MRGEAGGGGRGDNSRGGKGVQGGGAPAGVCARARWREVLQRFKGDERGCDGEGGGVVCRGNSPDPGRERQGFELRRDGAAAARAGEDGYHNWFSGGKD